MCSWETTGLEDIVDLQDEKCLKEVSVRSFDKDQQMYMGIEV